MPQLVLCEWTGGVDAERSSKGDHNMLCYIVSAYL